MICSGATISRAAASLCLLFLLACGSASPATRKAADLTNPFLGPEHTSWLVGPIAHIATPEEIQSYLALQDDAQAAQFIEQFWARRDPSSEKPGNPLREAFDERSTAADRLFTEAGYRGRRTDRGAVFILYGPPSKTDFEISPSPGEPPVETWTYGPTAPAGLDGRKPATIYRFIKRGDLTVTYIPGQTDPRLRQPAGLPPG